MSFKCIMDSVLSSVLGQVSVVLVFKACWLFPAHPMAVSPSAQPAGWGSGSTLPLWPLFPVFLLSQVSEYSDSFLLHHVLSYAFLPLFQWLYCFLVQPNRVISRRSINHSGNHWMPAGERSVDAVGERQKRTKAFIKIYNRNILYWLIFVRILCIVISLTSASEHLLSSMLHFSIFVKRQNIT